MILAKRLFILLIFSIGSLAWANSRVLIVSPEQKGILQTGGLAHATKNLAVSLNQDGTRADVLMPFYLKTKDPLKTTQTEKRFSVGLDWRNGEFHRTSQFSLYQNSDSAVTTYFLKHDEIFEKNYFNNHESSYGIEAIRGEAFAAFSKAAAEFILSANYDVVILNDWTTGLVATYLKDAEKAGRRIPKIIFAIHNIAYQGVFPKSLSDFLGLTEKHFNIQGFEYWNQMSFMKAGLQHSDMIYTVSPQYALEIATPRFGAGLDGVIRQKALQNRVTGILNGIDNEEWKPSARVAGLEETFSSADLSGKAKGKASLQKALGFEVNPNVPLFIMTSRLAEQKGFEYLIDALRLSAENLSAQWIIMGDGDQDYVRRIQDLEAKYRKKVRYLKFSAEMEKRGTRYGDFFVNGAWFEPSGLNQMFALLNGTLPVVSRVGGLINSVKHQVTGLLFDIVEGQAGSAYDKAATQENAYQAFKKATEIFADKPKLKKMRLAAMSERNSSLIRVQSEFNRLFDYVLKEGYRQAPIKDWKYSAGAVQCGPLVSGQK